jgi:hypothetical protein
VPVAIVTTQLRGLIIQTDSNGRRLPTSAEAQSRAGAICKICNLQDL